MSRTNDPVALAAKLHRLTASPIEPEAVAAARKLSALVRLYGLTLSDIIGAPVPARVVYRERVVYRYRPVPGRPLTLLDMVLLARGGGEL